jgi:hypothetical protein
VAQSTPSCSFNFVPDRPTGSWPANQTPRNNVTRKHTRSHGQVWLVTKVGPRRMVMDQVSQVPVGLFNQFEDILIH